MLGPFSPPAWQDRDPRVAAQAKRDPKQAPVNRHAVLRSVGVATRCDGHSPAAEIDLRSPCKRDGATAPLARLSPDRRRPPPPAPPSDLRPHAADSRASAPMSAVLLGNISSFVQKLKDRLTGSVELTVVVSSALSRSLQIGSLQDSLLMPLPVELIDTTALGRRPNVTPVDGRFFLQPCG